MFQIPGEEPPCIAGAEDLRELPSDRHIGLWLDPRTMFRFFPSS